MFVSLLKIAVQSRFKIAAQFRNLLKRQFKETMGTRKQYAFVWNYACQSSNNGVDRQEKDAIGQLMR
jgi:hypothetical protein